jgi:hypothetical protein
LFTMKLFLFWKTNRTAAQTAMLEKGLNSS